MADNTAKIDIIQTADEVLVSFFMGASVSALYLACKSRREPAHANRIVGLIRNHTHSLIGIRPSQSCVVSPRRSIGKRNFNVFSEICAFKIFRNKKGN